MIRRAGFEAILHAGQHKTGTTSIQRFLRDNRGEFLRQGLYLPQSGCDWSGSHQALVTLLAGQQTPGCSIEGLSNELAQMTSPRLLISAEHAKKLIVEGLGEKLVERLCRLGASRIQIIVYIRCPFALANAIYAQWTGALVLGGASFDEFIQILGKHPYFEYGEFLKLAQRPEVELVARPYSAPVRDGVVQDFLALLDLDGPVQQEERHNRSIGPIALEALRAYCRERLELARTDRPRLRHLAYKIARSIDEKPFWCIDERAKQQLAGADRKTEEFSQAIWGRGWREAIGEEERSLNIFSLDSAGADERALYETLLTRLREAGTGLKAPGR